MTLFSAPVQDAAIVLLVSAALAKYALREKELKGINMIVFGGLFLLITSTFTTIDVSALVNLDLQYYINIIFNSIAFILVIIGTIKALIESYK